MKKEATAVAEPAGVPATTQPHKGLLAVFGERYNVPAGLVRETLQKTAFPEAKNDSEFIAMLVVANTYGLNPFLKQIMAFSKGGKVTPVVPYDGWVKIVNEQPSFRGVSFAYSEEKLVIGNSKPCFEWIECSMVVQDRVGPVTVREYFDESYMTTDTWAKYPKRMLRNRAYIQCARMAFGISGIVGDDDAVRIRNGAPSDIGETTVVPTGSAAKALAAMGVTPPPPSVPEDAPEPPEEPSDIEDAEYDDVDFDPETGEVIEEPVEDAPVETVSDFDKAVKLATETLNATPEPDPELAYDRVTARQLVAINGARAKYGWNDAAFNNLLSGGFGVKAASDVPSARARELISHLQHGGGEVQTEMGN